jgi:GAF domain-containing protein
MDRLESFLQELAMLAAGIVTPNASCGITLRRDGSPVTVASSDERASALDETQYEVSDGPCLHSVRTGETVVVADLDDVRQRWTTFADRADELGLVCSVSLPLTVDDEPPLGAMNVYSFDGRQMLEPEQRHRLEVFAGQASGALQVASLRGREIEIREQLETALSSRTVIDQALGILMGQQRCTADEAFALLRMRSQSSQRKLRDIAAELVTRVSGQPPQPGPSFAADRQLPGSHLEARSGRH